MVEPSGWEQVQALLEQRLAGGGVVDDFGFDPEFTDAVFLPLLRPFFRSWFRVEVTGLENVPSTGSALIVANHAGVLPWDALMTQVALADLHPAHRRLRMLAGDLVFELPFIGDIARRAGHTLACQSDAERLLGDGAVVGVWPEGYKGIGKPFDQRYRLQRFGRGGFVSAALATGAPIVPTAIVGAEEASPMLADLKPLARALGLPYFPVTPTFPMLGPLGLIPLPSRWCIHFGEPIETQDLPADPMLVFELTDRVRDEVQRTLYRLLISRGPAFG